MSQATDAVQLCALLVDETYGELASLPLPNLARFELDGLRFRSDLSQRIFTILLRRGRLPIQALAQHTRLNKKQLRLGLVVLIQQNLIYYTEEGSQGTYYEANQDAAYGIVRSGKILDIIQTRYGVVARDLVLDLFLLGHAKVGELIDQHRRNRDAPANGADSTHAASDAQRYSPAQLDSLLYDLLEASLLQPINHTSFRSPNDTYNEVEQYILKSEYGGSTKGVKQKDQLKNKIREKLASLRFEQQTWKTPGNKRKADIAFANGTNGSAKRRRYSNGSHAVNGNHAEEDESLRLDPDLVIRINYEKFAVAIRNMRLVELAHTRIGETTSLVYGELLRLLEEYIPRCRPDPQIDSIDDTADGPKITTLELVAGMNQSINVGTGIGKAASDKVNVNQVLQAQSLKRRRSQGDSEAEVVGDASADEESDEETHGVNGNGHSDFVVMDDASSDGDEAYGADAVKNGPKRTKVTFQEKLPTKPVESQDEQSKWSLVRNHLMLLAADESRFLRRCGSAGRGEWTVDFDRLMHFLRQSELDSIILENFDTTGHRLVRMMRKTGKMDEKQLSTMSLMKQKDVRTKMVEMQMSGMADVQEVPKDTTRANNRTIFLWFFDSDRVSSIILSNVYKTMMRCFQRLEIERRRASGILSLTERSDVKDHIEEAFSGEQMNMLRKIRDKEDKLLGQVGRLDDLVGTFAEF